VFFLKIAQLSLICLSSLPCVRIRSLKVASDPLGLAVLTCFLLVVHDRGAPADPSCRGKFEKAESRIIFLHICLLSSIFIQYDLIKRARNIILHIIFSYFKSYKNNNINNNNNFIYAVQNYCRTTISIF